MILPKRIRKMIAVFRGGVSPGIIVFSILLGFWFGLMPGWSGFHTAIVIAVLVFNIHTGLFLLSGALGKALCFAAAPVLFHTGVMVQNYLSGLLRLLSAIPVIGITDFSRCSVAGAMIIGPIVGLICGLLFARMVIGFRRMMLKFEENSEQFKKWYSKRWVRLLDRVLIGKRTKDVKALFTVKTKIFRKAGVVVAVVVLLVSAIAAGLIKDDAVKDYAAKTMTRVNKAEVNLKSVELSVLAADFSASQIEVTDPDKPENNKVSIDKITADASFYNLLVGRVVMDNIELSNIKFDQKRASPGKVVDGRGEEKTSVFEPNDFEVSVEDIRTLDKYFKNAKAIKEWLQKVRKWLPKAGQKQNVEEIPEKYLDYLKARMSEPATPRLLAKRVLLDNLEIPWRLFGNSKVLLRNISDSAQAAKLPVSIEMNSHDKPASLSITFDYAAGGRTPKVSGSFEGFDLQSALSGTSGLAFESGIASGKFEGELTSELIDIIINATIRDMKAKSQGAGILGLDSKTSSQALEVLENFDTTIRIVGPVSEPRLALDSKQLQEQIKQALVKAGKERITEEIDKQIDKQIGDKLGDKVPAEGKELLEKSKGLLEGIIKKKEDK